MVVGEVLSFNQFEFLGMLTLSCCTIVTSTYGTTTQDKSHIHYGPKNMQVFTLNYSQQLRSNLESSCSYQEVPIGSQNIINLHKGQPLGYTVIVIMWEAYSHKNAAVAQQPLKPQTNKDNKDKTCLKKHTPPGGVESRDG